jgi:hypothetical protein
MAVLYVAAIPNQEALSVSFSSRTIERVGVTFDEPTLVAMPG